MDDIELMNLETVYQMYKSRHTEFDMPAHYADCNSYNAMSGTRIRIPIMNRYLQTEDILLELYRIQEGDYAVGYGRITNTFVWRKIITVGNR